MHNPDAIFDTYSIVAELEVVLNGVSRREVQRAAYLACLLALYSRRPISEWGYKFARTDFGTPFSAELNDAIDALIQNGSLEASGDRLRSSPSGEPIRSVLLEMSQYDDRKRFIRAACGSAVIVPPAVFSESLDNEPTAQRALQREKGGALLEGAALKLLYEQFELLAEVLEDQSTDLLTSSVVWLSYMADQQISRTDAGRNA